MSLEFPELVTSRLVLEPLAARHADGMFALWREPEVCRYSGEAHDLRGELIPLPAATPEASGRILEFWVVRAGRGDGVRWAALDGDGREFVGAVGFNSLGEVPELAFHLHPSAWGRGVMAEASRAVLGWAERALAPEGFEAFADAENVASLRLLTRLGFREEGAERDGALRFVRARGEA